MSATFKINGGDEENRTPDPLLARQVLSQLSYAPKRLRAHLRRKQVIFYRKATHLSSIFYLVISSTSFKVIRQDFSTAAIGINSQLEWKLSAPVK